MAAGTTVVAVAAAAVAAVVAVAVAVVAAVAVAVAVGLPWLQASATGRLAVGLQLAYSQFALGYLLVLV